MQAWLWRRIALTHLNAKQLDLADAASKRAVEIAEADVTGASQLELMLSARADVLTARGAFDEARAALLRSLVLARHLGNTRSIGVSLLTLGELESAAGNLAAAEDWFQQLVASVEPLPDSSLYYAQALSFLGDVQLKRADYTNALRTLKKSATLLERLGLRDDSGVTPVYINLAEAELAEGRRADGAASIAHAVAILDAFTADPRAVASDRFNAACVLWKLDKKKAVQLAKAARDSSDGARKAEMEQWLALHP